MSSPSTPAAWFADNRANWDDRAALHEASGYGIQRLVSDPAAMSDELAQDRERLGDLAGRDVIHLQCHLGTDTVASTCPGSRCAGPGTLPAAAQGLPRASSTWRPTSTTPARR